MTLNACLYSNFYSVKNSSFFAVLIGVIMFLNLTILSVLLSSMFLPYSCFLHYESRPCYTHGGGRGPWPSLAFFFLMYSIGVQRDCVCFVDECTDEAKVFRWLDQNVHYGQVGPIIKDCSTFLYHVSMGEVKQCFGVFGVEREHIKLGSVIS